MIQSDLDYTNDGNFLKSVTDTARNTVTYSYNTEKSTLTSVTDARGATTSNTYDAMGRLKSSAYANGGAVSYTYNVDRLSSAFHSGGTSGTTCNFTYTTAGLADKVTVGSGYTLVDNAYNSGTWTLASQTYGNGDAWHYTYNEFDDLVSAYTTGGESGTELKYFYNSEGALARIEQYETTLSGSSISSRTLVSTERYYYDSAERMVRITREDADGDTYGCSWEYDHNNNVTELVETVNGVSTTTAYTYDADQRVKEIAAGGITAGYSYDGYGRLVSQITKNGSTAILTDSYSYRSPGSGLTSTQVETLAITAGSYSVTYQYAYDANGNITSVTSGGTTTRYTYDAMNQLTREDNEAAGKTWVWSYDAGGNITSKKEYAYTTGALGTADATVSYSYGDAAWGDLLTAYNGTAITHDGIGNPLNDGTWSYSWDGRQLNSMTDGTTTWSYEYDFDGLRTERSNGSTTYEYVYSGSSLVQMTVGSNILRFAYDGTAPMTVTCNGTVYYYVTNLQGDVVAILDGSGSAVVQYTYDAWGNLLGDEPADDTIGRLNPLRYRGYVYDSETKLYYCQSRYYDPELGRFINADAYASTGQGLLGNNMFAYCNNNPVSYSDATGNRPKYIPVCIEDDEGENFITDQRDAMYGFQRFGVTSISHGGCGVIASYNALIMLGDSKSFDKVLGYYNNRMVLILGKGLIGLSPGAVARYFRDLGYHVTMTNSPDLIDIYSQTADASILYYEFPATYWGIEAYGAHFVAYHQTGSIYTAYNTAENNGAFSFSYPSDYGYKNTRYYAIGIFIYK